MNASYLAGLFDGEGCIHINKVKSPKEKYNYSLALLINMNCEKVLYEVENNFGGHVHEPCKYGKNKKIFKWYCGGFEAENILKLILPDLIEKKKQAELAIDYFKIFGYGNRGVRRSETEKQLQELYYIKMRMLKNEL